MGSLAAQGMVEVAGADSDIALAWHLQSNHYPPVPESMIPVARAAIEAGNREDWDAEIALPDGVTYRDATTAPAHAIIEAHHLDAFLDTGDELEV